MTLGVTSGVLLIDCASDPCALHFAVSPHASNPRALCCAPGPVFPTVLLVSMLPAMFLDTVLSTMLLVLCSPLCSSRTWDALQGMTESQIKLGTCGKPSG